MASMLLCLLLAGPVIPPRAAAAKANDRVQPDRAEGERPTPLTKTQITKLRRIIRRTQGRNTELKTVLNDRQQELMQAYSQFRLIPNSRSMKRTSRGCTRKSSTCKRTS